MVHIYRDLAYVFLAAVFGGIGARILRQPLIVGYVLGGMLIGPFTPGPTVSDVHGLELIAETGVMLLMYSIGIEFSPRDLLSVKWVAIAGGPLGILLSILLGLGVGSLLGWSTQQGIAVGTIVSVASTMVLSKLLIDQGQLNSQHGRIMIGITLVEDLAVVILTVLLPSLAGFSGDRFLQLGILLGKALLIMVPVILVAAKLVPPFLTRVAASGSQELFLLVAVALGFATAAITQATGLSLALGAFLAGVIVSGSEVAHDALSKLLPLRDVFVALFFVTVGTLVNPRVLVSHPSLLVTLLCLIVVGKFIIWSGVVRLFGYPTTTAVAVGIGLTQIGEFSYVLVRVARNAGIVSETVYNAILTASLISILVNALLERVFRTSIARPAIG